MSNPLQQLLLLNLLLPILSFFVILPSLMQAKSVIEPCRSSDSCTSLLSYILPFDSKISEVAYRFQVNTTDILATNSITPAIPTLGNKILRANSLVKIPISCPCLDGIRRSLSTQYTVREADTAESIADGYGGLVSAEQIGIVNGINEKNPLLSRQSLVIPLPCTCFNNINNGITTVYMSYVVQRGESLGSIGQEVGATVMDLEAINGLQQPVVDPGDILAIPISACSSANLNWFNESLIVPNGSYALTANNCIKCICRTDDLNLQCFPSGNTDPCSHLKCKGSNLFIGDSYVQHTVTGDCNNVTTCVYRGHTGRKIFRSLASSSQCPDKHDKAAASPIFGSPIPSRDPIVLPFITVAPSPAYHMNPTIGTGTTASGPTSYEQNSYVSGYGGILLGEAASCYKILLLPALILLHYFIW